MIQADVPLNQVQFIGTHNSFNDRADGYGIGDLLVVSTNTHCKTNVKSI